jgi:glycosyltransferase involved in cell wall biosynthesis
LGLELVYQEKIVSVVEDQINYKISIVTGCYKSVPFLERIYDSLRFSSYKNLEWITVDDCSPDNTLEHLYELKNRQELEMKVIKLPRNTRGVGAIAEGIRNATGDFTIIMDHDDQLIDNAIAPMLEIWNKLAVNTSTPLYGIWGRCLDQFGNAIERPIEEAPLICKNADLFHVYKLRNEWGSSLIKTEVLKKFYVFEEDIHGCTNGVFWNRMGQEYSCILTNIVMRRYFTNVPGSVTQSRKVMFPEALANQEAEYLNTNRQYFVKDSLFFLKKIIIYLKYNYHSGYSLFAGIKKLQGYGLRLLSVLLIPMFFYVLFRDKILK